MGLHISESQRLNVELIIAKAGTIQQYYLMCLCMYV